MAGLDMNRVQVREAARELLPPRPLCIVSGSVGTLRLVRSEERERPRAMFWNQRIWEPIDPLEIISAKALTGTWKVTEFGERPVAGYERLGWPLWRMGSTHGFKPPD